MAGWRIGDKAVCGQNEDAAGISMSWERDNKLYLLPRYPR